MERSRLEWPDTASRSRNPTRSVAWLSTLLLWGCMRTIAAEDPDTAASTDNELQTKDVTFDVTLLDTGRATIHATVYENATRTTGGMNVLAVHGWRGTSASWRPLAEKIFADDELRHAIKRIIAIDHVGHGDSSFPADLPNGAFGRLQVDDNTTVLMQSIDALRDLGLSPRMLLAHDLGGLEIQGAQDALLASGSSLAAHGVTSAVLLAPVPALGQSWEGPAFTLGEGGFSNVTALIVTDPDLGSYLPLPQPSAATSRYEYAATSLELAPQAPTTAEALAANYIGPEPFVVSMQMVQALPRTSVSPGVLAASRGTRTSILSFSEDIVVPAADVKKLYEYVTADTRAELYRPIVAADAVHNMLVSSPAGLIDALRELPW